VEKPLSQKSGVFRSTIPIRTNLSKEEAKRSSICDDINENKISIADGGRL